MNFIFLFILFVIFVESLTELIIKSELFIKFRESQKLISDFRSKLFSCGYCFSFWASIFPAAIFSSSIDNMLLPQGSDIISQLVVGVATWVFFILIFQRCSNFLHNFNDKWLDKFYSKKD